MDLIILIILVGAWFLMTENKNITTKDTVIKNPKLTADNGTNTAYKKLKQNYYSLVSSIIANNGLSVTPDMVLSIILKESYLQSLTKSNDKIIGDDGRSIGTMQISAIAVKDVNAIRGKNFSMKDVNDLTKNILIGSTFLDICFRSAKNINSVNPIKLAFKKYNGGNDETDKSKNSMAELYSNQAYDYFLKFSQVSV